MFRILVILGFIAMLSACKNKPIYTDPDAFIEDRVEDLLSKMTLDDKIAQLSGDSATGFDTPDNGRLYIPGFKMTDGPLGVRWFRATAFPSGISVAATWDTALVTRYAEALARETLAKGRNMLLGPCVNIHRFPAGGRNFESYGEDPYLTSRLAVNYIRALQANGAIASIKHFALNNQEWRRTEIDVQVDERTMREIYLPAFEAAVKEARVYTVMSAYNKVNGWWCSENDVLLNKILKDEWGFQGLVVSDWVSTHNTVNAAKNGLDIEMPHAVIYTAEKLKAAIKSGQITEEIINEKVRRILRVKFEAGLFDEEELAEPPDTSIFHGSQHKQLALEMAVNSMVLLKNETNILPLDLPKLKKIALIGPLAKGAPSGGGGSSHVSPYYNISPLDGIKKFVGDSVEIIYAPGSVIPLTPINPIPQEYLRTEGVPGIKASFFNNTKLMGKPVFERIDQVIDFAWNDAAPVEKVGRDKYSIRWTGSLIPPVSRNYTFYTASDDGVRFYINNKLLVNNWSDHGTTIDSAKISLVGGRSYDIQLEYYENGGSEVIQLGWDYTHSKVKDNLLTDAVNAAKSADVALVFAGTSDYIESEGYDRTGGLKLLAGQDELISSVAAVNPNTIVVIYSGTTVLTDKWVNKIPALIQAFFPGQEGGNAIAKLMFGESNFSGRLPFSYLASYNQSPSYNGYMNTSLLTPYSEGIFVGYRYLDKNNLRPAFPFGFGLSYTSFDYSDLSVKKIGDYGAELTLKVTNTGKMEGSEVVQVYMIPEQPITDRAIKELKGFTKLTLKPGEERSVTLKFNKRSFSRYDTEKQDWVVDPGLYTLKAGRSSTDLINPGFTFLLK